MNGHHKMDSLGSLLPPVVGNGDAANSQELQKLLIDEKMRCEHHKANYQTIKAEHIRYMNLNSFLHLNCWKMELSAGWKEFGEC